MGRVWVPPPQLPPAPPYPSAGAAPRGRGCPGRLWGNPPALCPCSCPLVSVRGHASELRRPLHDAGLEGAQVQRRGPHPGLLHRQARGSAQELARGQLFACEGEDPDGWFFRVHGSPLCFRVPGRVLPLATQTLDHVTQKQKRVKKSSRSPEILYL